MKADQKQVRIAAFLLGSLGSFGGIGCIVTGLRFTDISLPIIALFCLITALITSAATGRKLLGVAIAGFLLALFWSWQKGSLNLSLEAFLNQISRLYDQGYGWGVIRWSTEPLSTDMAQPVLCALGILMALGICWSFLRCKGIWLTALLIGAPVIPCIVLIDTAPAAPFLFIQLLCLVLMIRLARKTNQGATLLKLLVLPVAAAVLILFLCLPQKSYASFKPVDAFLGYVQEFFTDSGKEAPPSPVHQEGKWVNLTAVGPKRNSRSIVMDVTASQSGSLYLRGAAYDTYHGTWWDCNETTPVFSLPPTNSHTATITTRVVHDVLYLPYGTYGIGNHHGSLLEAGGQVSNGNNWRSYTVQYQSLPDPSNIWQNPSAEVSSAYTQLPAITRINAVAYLNRELPELQQISASAVWPRAQAIVQHVSRSADYSLQTPKMPSDRDFALWFLEESDSGYCIHFATAAAVLLRAAEIPCRYVTGYLFSAQAGHSVEVKQQNAHAWVECYIDGVGWVPLEPTPGNGLSETIGIAETTPSEITTSTQITETTEDTRETTVPTQAEESTESTTRPPLTTAPSEETSPVGGADRPDVTPDKPVKKPLHQRPLFVWTAAMLCAIGLVLGQWRLRVRLRQQKCRRGKRNVQALTRWRLVVLHCKIQKEEPDSRLLELAQKARFSHHAITREELQELDNWLNDSIQKLRTRGLWMRFLATIILALY